jgi:hypothetical protein
MRVVRWILLPIVCIAAWIAALFTGIVAHSAAELFCPADQMVSGMCVAPWFETLDAWLIRFFSAFAASLIIVSYYFTAPAARVLVAWVVFGLCALDCDRVVGVGRIYRRRCGRRSSGVATDARQRQF